MRKSLASAAAALGIITTVTLATPALAASARPAVARSPVTIHEIYYNSPGSDRGSNASLDAEWVDLRNSSASPVTLSRWTLRDTAGHVYTFGTYRLGPHADVKIHTGRGANTHANLYWKHSWYIWNNNGDRATLENAGRTVMSGCSYSDPSEVRAFKIC
ncbi:MAG: lamin tail domain-containing protein [Actinomycetota bacterium]|nr:lamin tail domain-containing protein [Actinomycetota bacterium]